MKIRILTLLLATLAGTHSSGAAAKPEPHPGARAFLAELAAETGADRVQKQQWRTLLAEAKYQDSIIKAISRPAEKTKPWKEYRPIFMTEGRIADGARFYREHRELLDQVARETGVPAEMIVAIIGVETSYGRITGSYRVLDALTTLSFYYPPREPFFRGELKQYLQLGGRLPGELNALKGSYAGAMGWGQFMPTSFHRWAMDGDADGKVDLWGSKHDIFYSIANYFVAHGWERGMPVCDRATVAANAEAPELKGTEPVHTIGTLQAMGYTGSGADLDVYLPATILDLEAAEGKETWITYRNFYVISRYNRSPLYSMAVHQLSEAIAERAKATP
ncbi:MAG: lytic murein transglycosylase B [Ahniella sp.]|nr:lytic murein transglycosylase B [Ahniella sp.]